MDTKSAKRNFLFDGAYGNRNTGDDLFCAISAWGAMRFWSARRVRFVTANLPIMPESVAPLVPQAILAGKRLYRGYVYSLLALTYRLLYAAKSSAVVYAGGSTLWRVPFARRVLARGAHLLGTPLVGIGLSVGPFRTAQDRQRVEHFLQQFSFLALRDHASGKEAVAMSLPYTPVQAFDLAGLLPAVYGAVNRRETMIEPPTLGVALCHYERFHPSLDQAVEASREERVKETLVRLAERESVKIRFYVLNAHPQRGDWNLAREMSATLEPLCSVEIVHYMGDPGQMWRQVAECDAFLAVRLHAAVLAYMAHVPFVMVAYHPKCTDFAEYVGLPEPYSFSSRGPEPIAAVEILSSLLHAPQFPDMTLQDAQARAQLNFTAAPWHVQQD
jgi:polysaccharide pyruvyl transferase WcaK-like protein